MECCEEVVSQAVKVALHIRPLIVQEQVQGCKECIFAVPNEPQVRLGSHIFTFDHVYGNNASPPSVIFDECVSPLVDGLFSGYNATVLAYGQTGSGKTYTMGTGGNADGIVRRVMEMLFHRIGALKDKINFQMRVSFIEILKEDIHDLLDPSPPPASKPEPFTGVFGIKPASPMKPPILIRESTSGGITMPGVTEVDVRSLQEMASCLEQGSLSRATGSTNMNSCSSRSHAIFTINMEQHKTSPNEQLEEFLCAKLHLVDLAGSERAKRTGADGMRFKEGVHINKGLLALGNVISALGDDRKRKEGGHVPYRDSKLTRLLQDSLGGNSRTVMIACVSPADSNAEETLNTLKYANRARNIQNKATVNRDPTTAELQRLKQQVELLQSQLVCARAAGSPDEFEILKERVAWLEARNTELSRELQQSRQADENFAHKGFRNHVKQQMTEDRESGERRLNGTLSKLQFADQWTPSCLQAEHMAKLYMLRNQVLEAELQRVRTTSGQRQEATVTCLNGTFPAVQESIPVEAETDTHLKELEHTMLQSNMDKELQELNKKLAEKEAEMENLNTKVDPMALKQQFEKKLVELEEEKNALQRERDVLLAEIESITTSTDEHTQKMQESHVQKLKELEYQITELKKKQDSHAQLLKQKQRSDEASKRLLDDIYRIKHQKVQLQQKIKQESEQFRLWKVAREKELLQLKKEGRRHEFEMHKLQALQRHQKMVLQRKTEEAANATRRLKELLESRKPCARGTETSTDEKSLQEFFDHELELALHIHEVRLAYDKQSEARSVLATGLAGLEREFGGHKRIESRKAAQITLLGNMLNTSSEALVAMASELSEAEEREANGKWHFLKSMSDVKAMLSMAFDAAVCARCELKRKQAEMQELEEKVVELTEALRFCELRRTEFERLQRLKEQAVAVALAAATKSSADFAVRCGVEELSQLQYTSDSSCGTTQKVLALDPLLTTGFQSGKLWKWKESQHHRRSLHFKWKWQKPWRLSEWGMGKGAAGYRFDVRHRDRWKRIRI